jgi:hypothetical protein
MDMEQGQKIEVEPLPLKFRKTDHRNQPIGKLVRISVFYSIYFEFYLNAITKGAAVPSNHSRWLLSHPNFVITRSLITSIFETVVTCCT